MRSMHGQKLRIKPNVGEREGWAETAEVHAWSEEAGRVVCVAASSTLDDAKVPYSSERNPCHSVRPCEQWFGIIIPDAW